MNKSMLWISIFRARHGCVLIYGAAKGHANTPHLFRLRFAICEPYIGSLVNFTFLIGNSILYGNVIESALKLIEIM